MRGQILFVHSTTVRFIGSLEINHILTTIIQYTGAVIQST